jgi:hypothetical protein
MAKRKGQKDKQHNGQKKMTEGQATQSACPFVLFFWSLCCLSFCPFLLVIVLLVLLSLSFGHCVVKDKQHNDKAKRTEVPATQWSKEYDRRTSNTMTKRK